MAEVERSVSDVARTTAVARARAQLSARERIGRLLENEAVFGYLMVAPAILYILILVGYPFAIALWFTVSDATVSQPIGPFTGLTNLKFVLDDEVFKRALANTFVFTISSQLIQMVFGTVLAFLLLRHFRGRRLIRAIVMLNPTYSVVNWVGAQLGFFPMLGGPNWLGEEQYAMISIIVVNVWRNLPFTAIVLTAGISSIPQEILEAASLDGAGWLTRWRKIMAPIIAPIIYIALLFSLVFTFTDMTVVWLLTKGSPVNSTHVIASYAFVTGVISGGLGRGAAMSLFLFPVLLVGALMLLRNLKARTLD